MIFFFFFNYFFKLKDIYFTEFCCSLSNINMNGGLFNGETLSTVVSGVMNDADLSDKFCLPSSFVASALSL